MPSHIRIVVADDDVAIRVSLRAMLDPERFSIVGEATDGAQAAAKVGELQPDVLVLDLNMPGVGGSEAIPLVRAASPRTAIVVYSADPSARDVAEYVEAVVPKDATPERFERAIELAAGRD